MHYVPPSVFFQVLQITGIPFSVKDRVMFKLVNKGFLAEVVQPDFTRDIALGWLEDVYRTMGLNQQAFYAVVVNSDVDENMLWRVAEAFEHMKAGRPNEMTRAITCGLELVSSPNFTDQTRVNTIGIFNAMYKTVQALVVSMGPDTINFSSNILDWASDYMFGAVTKTKVPTDPNRLGSLLNSKWCAMALLQDPKLMFDMYELLASTASDSGALLQPKQPALNMQGMIRVMTILLNMNEVATRNGNSLASRRVIYYMFRFLVVSLSNHIPLSTVPLPWQTALAEKATQFINANTPGAEVPGSVLWEIVATANQLLAILI
jgi:hypothetical protein